MIQFEGVERKLILGYILEQKLNASDGKFIIRESIQASIDAKIEYESMSQSRKLCIYKKIVDNKIVDLIFSDAYERSLFMEFVNGNPEKRKMRIREWAHYKVRSMGEEEKKKYYEKMELQFYGK